MKNTFQWIFFLWQIFISNNHSLLIFCNCHLINNCWCENGTIEVLLFIYSTNKNKWQAWKIGVILQWLWQTPSSSIWPYPWTHKNLVFGGIWVNFGEFLGTFKDCHCKSWSLWVSLMQKLSTSSFFNRYPICYINLQIQ